MAKWTLSDFIFQLRTRNDILDDDLYTDEELTAYINEGIQKMAIELQKQGTATITLENKQVIDFKELFITEEQKLLELEARTHNFAQLRSLYLNDSKMKLETIENVEQGIEGFYIWGDTINLSAVKSGTLKVLYIKSPKFLSAMTDYSDLPEKYQDIPLEYAIAKCKQKDGDYGLYDYSLNQFETMKQKMKEEVERQNNSSGISMMNITDYVD